MQKIRELLQDKKKQVIPGLIIIILLFISLRLKPASKTPPQSQDTQNPIIYHPEDPPLTRAAQLQDAIEDQKTVDNRYSSWQESTRKDYPWTNELPIYSEKYFVYFDTTKKIFIAKLYPQIQDNIDKMKSEIENRLTTDLEVPLEQYKIDWKILPQ